MGVQLGEEHGTAAGEQGQKGGPIRQAVGGKGGYQKREREQPHRPAASPPHHCPAQQQRPKGRGAEQPQGDGPLRFRPSGYPARCLRAHSQDAVQKPYSSAHRFHRLCGRCAPSQPEIIPQPPHRQQPADAQDQRRQHAVPGHRPDRQGEEHQQQTSGQEYAPLSAQAIGRGPGEHRTGQAQVQEKAVAQQENGARSTRRVCAPPVSAHGIPSLPGSRWSLCMPVSGRVGGRVRPSTGAGSARTAARHTERLLRSETG